MTITITANIPAKTIKISGKSFNYDARIEVFCQGEDGQWTGKMGKILQADVIDVCKKATNWQQIRTEHFPMDGFHN